MQQTVATADVIGAWVVCVLLIVAALVFWHIQVYLNHPRRRELNERWFDEFEQHLWQRYQDRELAWRYTALEGHFQDQSEYKG